MLVRDWREDAGMAVMRCPELVGRDEEQATLLAAVRHAAAGTGGVAFVLGEAGLGKSRLVAEAARVAADAGMRVLRGRAVEGGSRIPFRPAGRSVSDGAASGLGSPRRRDSTGTRPVPFGARRRGAAVAMPGSPSSPSLLLLTEGIVRFLRVLSRDGGVLMILEDLHWADEDTLAAVDYLADHLDASRALAAARWAPWAPAVHRSMSR